MVEYLPNVWEALGPIPDAEENKSKQTKKKQKQRRQEVRQASNSDGWEAEGQEEGI